MAARAAERSAVPDWDEDERLRVLRLTGLLDTPAERHFDRLTARAAEVCGTPAAYLSLVDVERQWFKSRVGLEVSETPRAWSFCEQTFAELGPMVVPDARLDGRFAGNPLLSSPGIRSYAGVAVRVEGQPLGALCVIDLVPRTFSSEQLDELVALAEEVELLLELCYRRAQGALHLSAAERAGAEMAEKRRQLASSELRHRLLVEHSPDGILVSSRGRISYANPAAIALLAPADGDLIGRQLLDFVHPDDRSRANAAAIVTEHEGLDTGPTDFRVQREDGCVVEVEVRSVSDVLDHQRATQTVIRDVSARVRAERTDAGLREAFALVAAAAPLTDILARLERVAEDHGPGPRCSFVLGESSAAIPSGSMSTPIRLTDGTVAAHLVIDAGSAAPDVELAKVLDDLCDLAALAIRHDEAREALDKGGALDELTGLPNRRTMRTTVTEMLEHATPVCRVVVVLVDLDDFTAINESFGHDAGDEVLRAVAVLLEVVLGEGDVLGRLAGDKFVVCRPGVTGPKKVEELVHRLHEVLRTPFRADGTEVVVHVNVGIATSGGDTGADRLLTEADTAVFRAKRNPGDAPVWFDGELKTSSRRRLELEVALRRAIERDELAVHYQPKVRLADGLVCGVEALARWTRPGEEQVHPAEFVPLAESTGLIHALGELVLRRACEDAARWRAQHPERSLVVAVNVSAVQLHDPRFVAMVAAALTDAHLPPATLCLELTETSVMRDPIAAAGVLRELKALGMTLSIDDFGTGHSSLSYLKDLPIDQLKIDRSFVADLDRAPEDRHIVAAIIAVAAALGLDVVAEGVETEAQLTRLVDLGCTVAQGFLWSPAIPALEVERFFEGTVTVPVTSGHVGAVVGRHTEDDVDDALSLIDHELRSPLAVIAAYGELLASGGVDGTEAGKAIERNARRASAMLDELSGVRQVSSGSIPLQKSTTDVVALLSQMIADAAPPADQRIELVAPPAPVLVEVDPHRVEQIIQNLLSNALRFSPPGEPVTVELDRSADLLTIVVADRGPGVPDAQTGLIFRKFGQAHRGCGSRTGLGLYLARGLARAHGGDLRYSHREGGGAVLTLQLPVAGPRHRGDEN